jgi:hypothetical protein
VYDVANHCLSFLIHRKTRKYNYKKKTNNGWQHHTEKNRQYNYKKTQTMVDNLIHRKTDNTIIKKDKQWLATSYTEKQTIQL